MFRKKVSPLSAAVGALVLSGALAALVVSPALARTSTRMPTSLAVRIARLSAHGSQRARAAKRRTAALRQAQTGRRPRIVGGYGAVQSDWPFMAFIMYFDSAGNAEFICTGTVVAPNVVLTAGHCGVDETTGAPLDPSGYAVVTGSVDWTNQAARQVSPVSRVVVNPAYNSVTDAYDAALLVLSIPTSAPAIPLATTADSYLETGGTGAVIAGWGETYYGDPLIQDDLQWASTVVQNGSTCAQHIPDFDMSSQLCAINPPEFLTGTCNGDSGGPLATFNASNQLVEIGIIDRGPADCDTVNPDEFANVIALNSWVANWINAVAPAPSPPPATPAPAPTPAPPAPTAPTATNQSSPTALPTMAVAEAKQHVRQTVAGALGGRARPAHRYTANCIRMARTRFTCGIQFWHGPNDYYGSVTVYLVSGPNGLSEWTDSYTLHWVNNECYYHSGHRTRCTVHNLHGSW
jgi:secreted trypsin-like serine protease